MADQQTMPLGMRQNNPGNLREAFGLAYRVPVANGFAQFKSLVDGCTSYFHDMSVKYSKDGLVTLPAYIARYAPPSENATASYTRRMALALNMNPLALTTTDLNLHDAWRALDFARAQFMIEQGGTPKAWPWGREWVNAQTLLQGLINAQYWQGRV